MKLLTISYNFRNVGYNLCYEAYNHIYKPCYNCHNFQSTPKCGHNRIASLRGSSPKIAGVGQVI